ncbi:helix-turn-helix domain-containing protein, partial [Coleofasciculus sp. C1-SOL-03]
MAEQRRHKITEAAEILGVNPWTLRRKVYKNQIPYI